MSTTGLTKFEIGSLDLSGVTDADFASASKSDNKGPGQLRTPGKYTLEITDVTLREGRPDGAGKKWGSILVKTIDTESKKTFNFFLDVPVETLLYTSKAGKTSKVKTQIFVNFLGAVLGTRPSTSELQNIISNLPEVLTNGQSFRTSLNYKRDHIKRNYNAETKLGNYTIALTDGSDMVDVITGETLIFSDPQSAEAYYTQVKGYKPATNMEVVSFLSKNVESTKVA
jgi:hypothetical protein